MRYRERRKRRNTNDLGFFLFQLGQHFGRSAQGYALRLMPRSFEHLGEHRTDDLIRFVARRQTENRLRPLAFEFSSSLNASRSWSELESTNSLPAGSHNSSINSLVLWLINFSFASSSRF